MKTSTVIPKLTAPQIKLYEQSYVVTHELLEQVVRSIANPDQYKKPDVDLDKFIAGTKKQQTALKQTQANNIKILEAAGLKFCEILKLVQK